MTEPTARTVQITRPAITDQHGVIESHHLPEAHEYAPTQAFRAQANVHEEIYAQAADFEAFWAEQARTLAWRRPFTPRARLAAAPRRVVLRRRAERVRECARPSRSPPVSATASPFTGRASPATPGPSPTASCSTR
jgi:hypothetical protein